MKTVSDLAMQDAGRDAIVAAMDRHVHDLRIDGVGLRERDCRLRCTEVEAERVFDSAHRGSTLAADKAIRGNASFAGTILDIDRMRRYAHEVTGIDGAERVVIMRMLGFPDELGRCYL